jgi:hypothetical protein
MDVPWEATPAREVHRSTCADHARAPRKPSPQPVRGPGRLDLAADLRWARTMRRSNCAGRSSTSYNGRITCSCSRCNTPSPPPSSTYDWDAPPPPPTGGGGDMTEQQQLQAEWAAATGASVRRCRPDQPPVLNPAACANRNPRGLLLHLARLNRVLPVHRLLLCTPDVHLETRCAPNPPHTSVAMHGPEVNRQVAWRRKKARSRLV